MFSSVSKRALHIYTRGQSTNTLCGTSKQHQQKWYNYFKNNISPCSQKCVGPAASGTRSLTPSINFSTLSKPESCNLLSYSRLRASHVVSKRGLFIQTLETPNPNCLKFIPGCEVIPEGTFDFPNIKTAKEAPLAKALFRLPGIVGVFFGTDFITVTKADDDTLDWLEMKAEVLATITDFLASGIPIVNEGFELTPSITEIDEDDDDTVQFIKELLDTKIRPTVQEDGGDILYVGFDEESGVLKLKMQGACTGCPSSSVTLKAGVQNMMQFYIPEVKRVEQVEDEEDEVSKAAFEEVELNLRNRPKPT